MQRTYRSGDIIEKIIFDVGDNAHPRKPKKKGNTPLRKQEQNERSAARKLGRLINANFAPGDMWITLKYDETNICDRDTATTQAKLFLRRVKTALKKQNIDLKSVLVTSDVDGKTGQAVRVHHHIIMPRLAYEVVLEKWKMGGVDYQLLRHQKDYTALAYYLLRQVKRLPDCKKYSISRNFIKPVPKEKIVSAGYQAYVPHGAVILERSGYGDGQSTQYVRYIAPPKKEKEETHGQ